MSCSPLGGNVGDRGQRFEVRYHQRKEVPELPGSWVAGEEKVFGWATTRRGANQMAEAWVKAPSVFDVWIVDRHALTVRRLAAALLALPAADQDRIVVALAIDGRDDDADGTAFDNLTNVGRTHDGRIVID